MSINHNIKGGSTTIDLACKTISIGVTQITSTATTANVVNIPESKIPRTIVTTPTSNTSFSGIPINMPGYTFPTSWAPNYKAKLAAASTGQCVIALVGDSISQGLNSSNLQTTSYYALLRQSLQALYGDGGSGYVGSVNSLSSQGFPGYTGAKTGVVLNTGTWAKISGEGPGSYAVNTTSSDAIATWTVRGSQLDLYYITAAGLGSFTVAVDGGTAVNVNSAGANGIGKYTVTGLSTGTHTIVLTKAADGLTIAYCGIRGTNLTGVIFDNYSIIGITSGAYVTRNTIQYGASWDWSGGQFLPCDLLIYAIAVNDATATGASNSDAYAQNVLTFIQGLKNPSGVVINTDIMFIAPAIGNYQVVGRLNYTSIIAQLVAIANMYGGGVINLNTLTGCNYQKFANVLGWGTAATDGSGASGTNAVHPGDIGMQFYANYILPILNSTIFTG